jgi:hypothetical protein
MRRFTAAFNARDVEAMIALCDQDVEFHSSLAEADGAIYRGHKGMRTYKRDMEEGRA